MKHQPDRLRRAMWRPVSEEARAAHLARIEAAVEADPIERQLMVGARRRLSVIAAAAALLVLPAGIAVAAEGSVPGDALYPIKKVTEKIRSLVDDDVAAEHRIEELEKLLAADAPAEDIAKQVDRAAIEVDRLASTNDLRPRFDSAADAVTADRVTDDPLSDGDDVLADPPIDKPPPTDSTTPRTDTTVPTTETTTQTSVPPDRTTTTSNIDSTTTTVPPDVETFRVVGVVRAGPTCPVARFPVDPDCEDQPVSGAVIVIADLDGAEITRAVSDDEGRFDVRLPSDSYLLIPEPVDGLLGTAEVQEFTVGNEPVELAVGYDTGIR